MLIYKPKH